MKTAPHPVHRLALRHPGTELLAATAARYGAELGARYGCNVPIAEIETVAARFSHLLQAACEVMPMPAVGPDNDDEA